MNIDLMRWPLLLGAVLAVGGGVWMLNQTGTEADSQFAAFALLLLGAVLIGAFLVHQAKKDDNDLTGGV